MPRSRCVLLDRGERDQALAEMDKGVEVDPQEAQSHLAQGALRQSVERYEEAIASYQTSAKLRPSAAPLIGAANASTHLNRQDEALAFLQRATQAEPKSVDAWLALGAATRQLHDWKSRGSGCRKSAGAGAEFTRAGRRTGGSLRGAEALCGR